MMTKNLINIRGDSDDPYERYKMPMLLVKMKNKGQFNDTTISGLGPVAKSLKVNEECLTKWFGSNLKTQGRVSESTVILKGAFDYDRIEQSLRGFIKTYVLCEKCNLPELIYLSNDKKKKMISRCQACGHRSKLNCNDNIWKIFLKHITPTSTPTPILASTATKIIPSVVDDEPVEWLSDLSDDAIMKRKTDNLTSNLLKDLMQ